LPLPPSSLARIDDHDRNPAPDRGFDGRNEPAVVERGEHDAAHALADEILDHLHLLLAVVLLERSLPDDAHRRAGGVEFTLGPDRAGVNGFPEFVGRALGNNRNVEGLGADGGNTRRHQREAEEESFHGVGFRRWRRPDPEQALIEDSGESD